MIDGFVLGDFQEFVVGDVGQSLMGQFDGFGEGALVGRFGHRDLYISYSRGDGNDIALFTTSIPEPGSAAFVILLGIGGLVRRGRRE